MLRLYTLKPNGIIFTLENDVYGRNNMSLSPLRFIVIVHSVNINFCLNQYKYRSIVLSAPREVDSRHL